MDHLRDRTAWRACEAYHALLADGTDPKRAERIALMVYRFEFRGEEEERSKRPRRIGSGWR